MADKKEPKAVRKLIADAAAREEKRKFIPRTDLRAIQRKSMLDRIFKRKG